MGDQNEKWIDMMDFGSPEIYPADVHAVDGISPGTASEFLGRQKTQQDVNYNSVGGDQTKACANCQWFISPDKCVVVQNYPMPITPNGVSDLWAARSIPEDMMKEFFESRLARKAVTKREGGSDFTARDYAVVPDAEKPSTWKLRLAETPGKRTVAQIARAITAMQPGGFRGNRVQLSDEDKSQAMSRIRSAINSVDAEDDQKQNLRDRLGKVGKETSGGSIFDWLRSKVVGQPQASSTSNGFKLFKDASGHWQWFAVYSNNFRDRDNPPEIFSEKAHQDFVDWVDAGNETPELWFWHTPGSRLGKAVWVGYDDHMAWAAGTIDPGMEHIAERLSKRDDLGVSHGYRDFTYSDKERGIIDAHRTFEISVLPATRAANLLTRFGVTEQEIKEMRIDPQKRQEMLSAGYTEQQLAAFESQGDDLAKQAHSMGLESKDLRDEPSQGAPQQIDYTALGNAAAKAMTESQSWKDLSARVDEVKTVTDQMPSVIQRLDALEAESKKSIDDRVDAALTSRLEDARKAGGHVASQSDANVKEGDPDQDKANGPLMPDMMAAIAQW